MKPFFFLAATVSIICMVALAMWGKISVENENQGKFIQRLNQISDDELVNFVYNRITARFGKNWKYKSQALKEMNKAQISLYYVHSFQIGFLWDGLELTFKNMRDEMPSVVSGLEYFGAIDAIRIIRAAAMPGEEPPIFISEIAKKYEKECGTYNHGQNLNEWYGCLFDYVNTRDVWGAQIRYIRKQPEDFVNLLTE